MDPQTYMDVATVVTKLKMYPYFDLAHYILMCISVREDILPHQGENIEHSARKSRIFTPFRIAIGPGTGTQQNQIFHRKHPLSSWLASMITCFAGSILANFLLGEPIITPFKDHQSILLATAVWYFVNYSPFDLVFKLAKFLPIKLIICILKETQRAHKVYHGVLVTAKLYPSSYLIIVLIGTIKGSGSGFLKNFERLLRGIWIPGNNELLQPSFTLKASIVASIIFLCERLNYIAVPHPLIYFGVVLFFIYFKVSSIILGIHDPFSPFENLFCAIFMGGMWDALRKAATKEPSKEEESKDPRNDVIKSKDDKKKE